MKKFKSLLFALAMTLCMVSLVAGCGKKTTTKQQTKDITVKSISAAETKSENKNIKMAKLNAPLYAEANEAEESFNYFVIVKSKSAVTVTITVDNPEDIQIDMVKIASSDEEATIRTWNNQESVWQQISAQPVVGWNGSTKYLTTYDVITKKDADEVTFTVTDFKVNGKWQESTDLGNNVLHVYKYNDEDLALNLKSNHLVSNGSEAKFEVNGKNGINVKKVSISGIVITAADGVYTATSSIFNTYKLLPVGNGVTIDVDYTYQLTDKIESETLKTSFTIQLACIENYYTYNEGTDGLELYVNVDLTGDEVSDDEIKFYYEGTPNIPNIGEFDPGNGVICKYKFTNPSWTSENDIEDEMLKTTIKIDGKTYKVTKVKDSFMTLEYVAVAE